MKKANYLNFTAFRNAPEPVLHQVRGGESVTLTRFGRPVAELCPPRPSGDKRMNWEAILSGAGLFSDLSGPQQKSLGRTLGRRKNFFRKSRILFGE